MTMRLLGIDYGSKRVGIASTDESGSFALPRAVLPVTEDLVDRVLRLAEEYEVERVVIGESKDLKGAHNPIHTEAKIFAEALQARGIDVVFHPEMFTSMEAERLQGSNDMNDASAAALILKSYIDSQNN